MAVVLRAATASDSADLRRIAAAGGSPDSDDGYFAFVGARGTLVVAVAGDDVVGFAGAVPAGGATMVTDLFVDPSARAAGLGRELLATVLAGAAAATTFSSHHPAALRLYEAAGLEPRVRLLTMEGRAVGGGARLAPAAWRHGRGDLVAHFAAQGATVTDDAVVLVGRYRVEVLRVVGDRAESVIAQVLMACEAGAVVSVSLLETDPLVAWLTERGFGAVDDDVWCATPDVVGLGARCVHRGLG